jgi:DNA-directed RNA polymerase sigma subunit (sigma70/sigma32)
MSARKSVSGRRFPNEIKEEGASPGKTEKKSTDLVTLYLNQMGHWKVLSDPTQVEYFKEKEKLEKELCKFLKMKNLHKSAIRRMKTQLKKITETLIVANLRLVIHIAKRFGYGSTARSHPKKAISGPMRAIEKFDYHLDLALPPMPHGGSGRVFREGCGARGPRLSFRRTWWRSERSSRGPFKSSPSNGT